MKKIDLTGKHFTRLTVVREATKQNNCISWLCQCDCGNQVVVHSSNLRAGVTRSCGCYNSDRQRELRTTHGRSGSSIISIWRNMLRRCQDPRVPEYRNYGARGITVCKRWQKFINFLEDMGERPKGKSLERKNNDKGYSPQNCKWATPAEQARNRRTCKITAEVAHEIRQQPTISRQILAEKFGVKVSLISDVRSGRGWH